MLSQLDARIILNAHQADLPSDLALKLFPVTRWIYFDALSP